VKAEASEAPNQPQLPPPATDVFTSTIARAHSLEIPSANAATPAHEVLVRVAASVPNGPDKPSFDALALKIASHSSNGDNLFSIRLDPPELGKIEVNLSVDCGRSCAGLN
jgi:flagellar hook-length control protein FliK